MSTSDLHGHPLRARDLLSRDLATVPDTATVDSARALMRHLDVRHLPVLGASGLAGLLHEPDLRTADGSAQVAGWVRGGVPEAQLQDGVGRLAALLESSTCGAVVVVDDERRLLGVLTEVDLRRAVVLPG
ncbi:MAG: hypothetical protein JWM64_2506 [Frankiales bacterium]|nr:hypothetical protein [Frankiales bacterium]